MVNTKRVALWAKSNPTRESSVFSVAPGQAVLLNAVGFEQYATQESGEWQVEQMACIERVLHEFAPVVLKDFARRCDWVLDLSRRMAEEIASESVSIGNCDWYLSMCHNLGIIGIPGSYRLRLNDDNAIGVVQVYAELYDIHDIAPQCAGAFFQ